MEDKQYIKKTLNLAKDRLGWTNPNPMVGAVIVKNNKIIGQGFYKKYGAPHAEVEAINSAKEDIKGSTLYVNLEPCSHQGKTPPCADLIIKSGITRVVCSTRDPNPNVNGAGLTKLKKAGVEIIVGILAEEARQLNEAFFTYHEKQRPFVAIKFAASLDGKIATRTGDSKWITSEKARAFARNLRSQYQAVLVGINTVIKDDPHLGTRRNNLKDPVRIILDSTLKIPFESQALRDSNAIVVTTSKADKKRIKKLIEKDIELVVFPSETITIPVLLKELWRRKIISVLVEGGSEVLGSFVDSKLVDKVYVFHAPIIIGGTTAKNAVGGRGADTLTTAMRLKDVAYKVFGEITFITGNIK